MADLTELNSEEVCDVDGGLSHSYVAPLKYLASITESGAIISAMTMSAAGEFVRYTYDSDGTSQYNQVSTRTTTGRGYTTEQTASFKFSGLKAAYVAAVNAAQMKCPVIAIHCGNNGTRHVQGIEKDASATGGFVKSKVREALIIPSADTGTANDSSNLSMQITSTSRTISLTTSLSDTAIEAL